MLGVAAWVDAREHRLPNLLTIPALGLNLGWTALNAQGAGWVWLWLLVVVAHGLLVVLPPYAFGGGDWKLIAAILAPAIEFDHWLLWLASGYLLASGYGLALRWRGRSGRIALGPWLVLPWTGLLMGHFAPCCVG